MAEEEKPKSKKMDAKKMLKENADKSTKIKYRTRIELEIIAKTKYYRKGQIINPHVVMGEQLIKDGIAKEVKK